MQENELRQALCAVGKSFYTRGLCAGAAGNLSARCNQHFLVTPTGSCLGELGPADISLVDSQGTLLQGPPPTKEVFAHLACYASRPDCGAVVHLHSPYAVAWSCLEDLDPGDAVPAFTPYGLMRYGRVGLAPYRKPGSRELVSDLAALMPAHKAVLLGNHGAVVCGASLREAADNMDELEASCRMALLLRGLPARQISGQDRLDLLTK